MPVKVDGVQTFRFQKHFSKLDGRDEFITYFKYIQPYIKNRIGGYTYKLLYLRKMWERSDHIGN